MYIECAAATASAFSVNNKIYLKNQTHSAGCTERKNKICSEKKKKKFIPVSTEGELKNLLSNVAAMGQIKNSLNAEGLPVSVERDILAGADIDAPTALVADDSSEEHPALVDGTASIAHVFPRSGL